LSGGPYTENEIFSAIAILKQVFIYSYFLLALVFAAKIIK